MPGLIGPLTNIALFNSQRASLASHSRTPRGVQKRRRTIPSLLRFPTRLDTFFSSPGFHSAGRHPKAATRKTNERTTYHESDPMQIVLLHRGKTIMSVGNPLLRKGGSQTLRQTCLCLLRIPQAASAVPNMARRTKAACGIRKRHKQV